MNYRAKAEEAFGTVQGHYLMPDSHLYRQNSPSRPGDKTFADCWAVASVLSAAVALLELAPADFEPPLRTCVAALDRYWQGPGYASYVINDGGGDRYYDDNEWVGIELLAASRVLKDQSLLNRAIEVFDFVVSGWSDDMGGGIYWRERDFSSKNACSNGPAIVLALKLAQVTGQQRYLDWAQRIYKWINERLRTPSGLYWDRLERSGQVESTIWSYNVGAMIQANVLLYDVTGWTQYLDEARLLAAGSLERFAGDNVGGVRTFPATPWFNAVLFRGYLALRRAGGDTVYADALLAAVNYAWDHARDGNGLFSADWSGRSGMDDRFRPLIDQAAVVEMFALAALAEAAASGSAQVVADPTTPPPADPGPAGDPAAGTQPVVLRLGTALVSPLGTSGSCLRSEDGFVCTTRRSGVQPVRSQLASYYERMGGPSGHLGWPVTGLNIASTSPYGTTGLFQRFEGSKDYPQEVVQRVGGIRCGSTVYWTEQHGPYATWFEIGAVYELLGGTGGRLGFPRSERVTAGPSALGTRGYVQRMEGGALYWGELRGTFPVWGEIGAFFERLGGIDSVLGFPVTAEQPAIRSPRGTTGLFQRFEGPAEYPPEVRAIVGPYPCGATVYWSARTGAHETWGEIGACYERNRGTGGPLGFPVGSVREDDSDLGGYWQDFEDGRITWRPGRLARVWLG